MIAVGCADRNTHIKILNMRNMKRLLYLATLQLTIPAGYAQTERRILTKYEQQESPSREIQEQVEALQDSIDHANAVGALERLDFVVEADKLVLKRGEMAFVNSTTNFISLSHDLAIIQIAPFNSGGPNGVGGITLNGQASNIKLKTDRKGAICFSMNVMGSRLSANVTIILPKGCNNATVTISPNFNAHRVTFYGRLYPSQFTRVFKGKESH